MKRFVCNLIGLILAMTVCVYMTSCTKAKSHSFKIEFSIDGCPLSYNRTYYDGSSVVVNHIYSGDPTNPSFGDGKGSVSSSVSGAGPSDSLDMQI